MSSNDTYRCHIRQGRGHRFGSDELETIARSDGRKIINGGGVVAHRLAEIGCRLSVTLDSESHLFEVVFSATDAMTFKALFDHFPTPTELWEFVTTRSLHLSQDI